MTDDELSKRKRMADEDLQAYLARRPTTIGSNADGVRIFYRHVVAMRQAGAAWEEIAAKLEEWSGRKIAPGTIKQYMTDINQGRMKLELSSTLRPQAIAPSAPPAQTSHSIQDSHEDQPLESSGTNTPVPDPADELPGPGGFIPGADLNRKRNS